MHNSGSGVKEKPEENVSVYMGQEKNKSQNVSAYTVMIDKSQEFVKEILRNDGYFLGGKC